ncbi:glycylpeptide N-tetradecanoyltransferase 2 isoform X1 [Tachysurus ichikawai]
MPVEEMQERGGVEELCCIVCESVPRVTKEEFEKIAADVKQVKSRPSDQELLDLYGLYKQGTVGDVNIAEPGTLDLKGKAKREAWNSRKGMSTEDAMTAYITLAKEVINKYGM